MPSIYDELYPTPGKDAEPARQEVDPNVVTGALAGTQPEVMDKLYDYVIKSAEDNRQARAQYDRWAADAATRGRDPGVVEEVAGLKAAFPSLSEDFIADNINEVRRQSVIQGIDFKALRERTPEFGRLIRDQEKAPLALDASGTLQGLESLVGRVTLSKDKTELDGFIPPAWWGTLRDAFTKQLPLFIAEGLHEVETLYGDPKSDVPKGEFKKVADLIKEEMSRDYWGTFSGDRDGYAYRAKSAVASAVDFVSSQVPLLLVSEIGGGMALAGRGGAKAVTEGLSGWRAVAAVGRARLPGVAVVNAVWFQPGLFDRFNDATEGQSPFLAAALASAGATATGALMSVGPVGLTAGSFIGGPIERGIFAKLGSTVAKDNVAKVIGNAATRFGYHFLLGKTTFAMMEGINKAFEEADVAFVKGQSFDVHKIGEAMHEGWKAGDVAWLMSAFGVGRRIFTEMGKITQAQETARSLDGILRVMKGLNADTPAMQKAIDQVAAGGKSVIYIPVKEATEAAKHEGVELRKVMTDAMGEEGGVLFDKVISEKGGEIPLPLSAAKKLAESRNFSDLIRFFGTFNLGDYSPFHAANWALRILPDLEKAIKLKPEELPPEEKVIYDDFLPQAERGLEGKFTPEDRKAQADTAARLVLAYVKGFQRTLFPDKSFQYVYDRTWGRVGIFSARSAPWGAELERVAGLYSQMDRAAGKLARKSGSYQTWMNEFAKLGIKPEELTDTGVESLLRGMAESAALDAVVAELGTTREELGRAVEGMVLPREKAEEVLNANRSMLLAQLGEKLAEQEARGGPPQEGDLKMSSKRLKTLTESVEISKKDVQELLQGNSMMPDIKVVTTGKDPSIAKRDAENEIKQSEEFDKIEEERVKAIEALTDERQKADSDAWLRQNSRRDEITEKFEEGFKSAVTAEDYERLSEWRKTALEVMAEDYKAEVQSNRRDYNDKLQLLKDQIKIKKDEVRRKFPTTDSTARLLSNELAELVGEKSDAEQIAREEFEATVKTARARHDADFEAARDIRDNERTATFGRFERAKAKLLRENQRAMEAIQAAGGPGTIARMGAEERKLQRALEAEIIKRDEELQEIQDRYDSRTVEIGEAWEAASREPRTKLNEELARIAAKYNGRISAIKAEEKANLVKTPAYGSYTMGGSGRGEHREVIVTVPTLLGTFDKHWGRVGGSGSAFHFRISVYEGMDGKSVFVVEEVQADPHQTAAKEARNAEKQVAKIKEKIAEVESGKEETIKGLRDEAARNPRLADVYESAIGQRTSTYDDQIAGLRGILRGHEEVVAKGGYGDRSGVPESAPFKKSWEMQAIRRIALMAVAEGHTRIAWVTGQTSGERYNAGSYVKNLKWEKAPGGNWHATGEFRNGDPYDQVVSPDKLEETFGAKIAEHLRSNPEGEMSGDQLLALGIAKGMEEAYDKRIPSLFKKLGLTNLRQEELPIEDPNAPLVDPSTGKPPPEPEKSAATGEVGLRPENEFILPIDQAAMILNGQGELPYFLGHEVPIGILGEITNGNRVWFDPATGLWDVRQDPVQVPPGWTQVDGDKPPPAPPGLVRPNFKVWVMDVPPELAAKISEGGLPLYERTLSEETKQGINDSLKGLDALLPTENPRLKELRDIQAQRELDPQEKSELNQILAQNGRLRGFWYSHAFVMGLTPDARSNTLFHEMSHALRDIMKSLWNDPDIRPLIDNMYRKLVVAMGYASPEKEGRSANKEEKVPYWFEQYVLTGNVPDPALIPLFARLFNFMADLARDGGYDEATAAEGPGKRYKELGYGILGDLPPEVKGVFDSILLSAEAVKNAEAEAVVAVQHPLIAKLMDDKNQAEYAQTAEQAAIAARDSIIRAVAASRRAFVGEERERLREIVAKELQSDPQYRMLHFFRSGELWGDEANAALLMGANGKPLRFKASDVEYLMGTEVLEQLKKQRGLITDGKGDYLPLDIAAQVFKFKDPAAMLAALRDALPEKEAINKRAEARLNALYRGWLVSDPQALAQAAMDGVQNVYVANKMLRELRALASKLGGQYTKSMMSPEAWQKLTEQIAKAKLVGEIKPEAYVRNAADQIMAAHKALEAGDIKAAYDAQEKAVLNHFLYREVRRLQTEFGKMYTKIAERSASESWRARVGLAHPDYRRLHDALLYAIEIMDDPAVSAANNGDVVANFLDTVRANGQESQLALHAWDVETIKKLLTGQTSWKQLDQETAREVMYAIENIKAIADVAYAEMVENIRVDRAMVQDATFRYLNGMQDVIGPVEPGDLAPADTRLHPMRGKVAHLGRLALANLKEARGIISMMGPAMTRAVWDTYMAARAHRNELLRTVYEEAKKVWEKYDRGSYLEEIPGLAEALPMEHLGAEGPRSKAWLMQVMKWLGTEESRYKMIKATGWNVDMILKAAEKFLTPEDMALVQREHDLYDAHLKPEAAEAYERRYGLPFKQAKEMGYSLTFKVPLPDGQGTVEKTIAYRGGYHPLRFDPRLGNLATRLERQSLENMGQTIPATPNGYTKPRTGYVDVPDFNWNGYANHLLSEIQDIAFGDWVRSSGRLLLDKETKSMVSQHLGEEFYKELRPWLERVALDAASGVSESARPIERALGWGRSALVYSSIGWNLGVAADFFHPIAAGLMQDGSEFTAQYVAPAYLSVFADGMAGLMGGKNEAREFALNNSLSLQNREVTIEQDLRLWFDEIINPKNTSQTVLQKIRDTAFWHIQQMDKVISTVIWTAKYNEAFDRLNDHIEAVREADARVEASMPTYSRMEMPSLMATRNNWIGSLLVFRGYWSKLFQMTSESGHEMIFRGAVENRPGGQRIFDASAWAGRVLGMLTLGAVGGELLLGHGPRVNQGEDWEEWFLRRELAAPFQLLPFASYVGEPLAQYAVHGNWKVPRSISVPGFAYYDQLVGTIGKLASDRTTKADKTEALIMSALMGLRLPARAPVRAGRYVYDRAQGRLPRNGPLDDLSGIIYGQKSGTAARNQELTPLTAFTKETR